MPINTRGRLAETDDENTRPRATFVCPKCRARTERVWPNPDGPNYCNACHADMTPVEPRQED